jgi:hypothetical protein
MLLQNITGGDNTAAGYLALFHNRGGSANIAVGSEALMNNTNDTANTAIGTFALHTNTAGFENAAVGEGALAFNASGSANTAIGNDTLRGNTTGRSNIALGISAGSGIVTASGVICIAAPGADLSNSCFIGHIRGVTTMHADTIPVVIDSAGQLGTATSSARFKKEIKPMDRASETILGLRPVTFQYKTDTKGIPQFGLIAEEVAEVNPDLVVHDQNGDIYTVRYDAVNAMLLNEFLKAHRKIEEQETAIAELKSIVAQQEAIATQQQKDFQTTTARQEEEIKALTASLKEQARQIQNVSMQLELSKSAPQTAANSQ